MSLIIPESAVGHVEWVIMEACGVASVGQVAECAAWQFSKSRYARIVMVAVGSIRDGEGTN